MTIIVFALLAFAAHFNLTAFVPAEAGKAWFGWPFAADTRPWLGLIGGLPSQGGSVITPLLAGVAGLGFLGALLGLLKIWVPAAWWPYLVLVAAGASALLFLLYFGRWSLLPLAIDAVLVWGVLSQHWSVLSLRGA